jgi:mevalonate kinase
MAEPYSARASAPARICLAGEDLDWLGGASIQAAISLRIDYRCDWVVRPTPFEVVSSGTLAGAATAADAWSVPTPWARLPAVCATFGRDRDDPLWPRKVTITSTIPPGAGLASSAALCTAGVAAAVGPTEPLDLMRQSWFAEHRLANRNVGPMDYVPSVLGGVSRVSCSESGIESLAVLGWPRDARVLVVDTGIRRDTSDVIGRKVARSASGDASIARYVTRTADIVAELGSVLIADKPDLVEVGGLITRAHTSLRDDMGVSGPLAERCVDALLRGGAVGAKITGSGEGGCVFGLFHEADAELAMALILRDGMWVRSVDLSTCGVELFTSCSDH